MNKILRDPQTYFLAQAAALIAIFAFAPAYSKAVIDSDSITYLYYFPANVPALDFCKEIFTSIRTFGYPIFLRGVIVLCGGLRFLPAIQCLLYAAAAWAFGLALTRFRVSRWAAFAVASALLYNEAALQYHNVVLTESLSLTLNIAVFASILMLASNPKKGIFWVASSLAIFASYIVRPSNIPNIALAPVAALLLMQAASRAEGGRKPRLITRGTLAVAVKLFALNLALGLLFCAARWTVTQDFGLGPFSGFTLSGIASHILRADDIPTLSEDIRPLAGAIVYNRRLRNEPDGFKTFQWSDYRTLEKYFDSLSYAIVVPVSCKMYSAQAKDQQIVSRMKIYHLTSDAVVIANKKLAKLSIEVIRRRPGVYAKIATMTFLKAIYFQVKRIAGNALLLIMTAALSGLWAAYVIVSRGSPDKAAPGSFRSLYIVSVIGLGYYAAQTLIIVPVQTPLYRYCICAALFFDAIVVAGIWCFAGAILDIRRKRKQPALMSIIS